MPGFFMLLEAKNAGLSLAQESQAPAEGDIGLSRISWVPLHSFL